MFYNYCEVCLADEPGCIVTTCMGVMCMHGCDVLTRLLVDSTGVLPEVPAELDANLRSFLVAWCATAVFRGLCSRKFAIINFMNFVVSRSRSCARCRSSSKFIFRCFRTSMTDERSPFSLQPKTQRPKYTRTANGPVPPLEARVRTLSPHWLQFPACMF
jgi:hypothetical protein